MKKYIKFSALKRADSKLTEEVYRLNKALDDAGNIDVNKVAKRFVKYLRSELKIRPRLRLLLKVLPVLVLAFLLTNKAVAYLEPKKADIKINGQAILVAEGNLEEAKSLDEVQISQSVSSKLSPFEFIMPVENGQISQGYASYHRAFDFATKIGSTIRPVGSGTVEFAGFVGDGKGNVVIVNHGDGLKTLYAHMGKIYVGTGNLVDADVNLGTVGLTGRTTGPHVHFEIYDNGVMVNPGNLLPG